MWYGEKHLIVVGADLDIMKAVFTFGMWLNEQSLKNAFHSVISFTRVQFFWLTSRTRKSLCLLPCQSHRVKKLIDDRMSLQRYSASRYSRDTYRTFILQIANKITVIPARTFPTTLKSPNDRKAHEQEH